eukprot:COSAG02_NODE_15623_length_1154_cov_1.346919_2_plen_34_part_01
MIILQFAEPLASIVDAIAVQIITAGVEPLFGTVD